MLPIKKVIIKSSLFIFTGILVSFLFLENVLAGCEGICQPPCNCGIVRTVCDGGGCITDCGCCSNYGSCYEVAGSCVKSGFYGGVGDSCWDYCSASDAGCTSQSCPTACGYLGGSVRNGNLNGDCTCGMKSCPATAACATPTPNVILPCPTGFNVSCSSSGTQATITWNDVSGAVGYVLRVNNTSTPWFTEFTDIWVETVSPSKTINIIPGVNYDYDVQGKKLGEVYPYSGLRCPFARFNCPSPTPTATPRPPTSTLPPPPPTNTSAPTPVPPTAAPTCIPNCACASSICVGSYCSDGCGGWCSGTIPASGTWSSWTPATCSPLCGQTQTRTCTSICGGTCSGSSTNVCSDADDHCNYTWRIISDPACGGSTQYATGINPCGGSCPVLYQGCYECEDCSPACGQPTYCGANCSNADNGVPTAPSIIAPNGTATNPTFYAMSGTDSVVNLSWSSNSSLTDYYQVYALNSANSVVWSRSSTTARNIGSSGYSQGIHHWFVRAVNTTCGTDIGATSVNGYFGLNMPPTFTSLRIKNANGVVVAGESGGTTLRNHLCQTTFQDTSSPRRVIFEASINDPDGAANITNTATLSWHGRSYTMNKVYSAGTGATMRATVDFGSGDNGTGVYDLDVRATDIYGGSTGTVDTDRDWKVWDCQVDVSGRMYDSTSSDGASICTSTIGYTNLVTDIFNFKSLRFSRSDNPNLKSNMTVSQPASYASPNYLTWGRSYINLPNDFNYVDGDGSIQGTNPEMRISGGNVSGYICGPLNLATAINPYSSTNSIVVDYSSLVNQEAWWQVEGGGVKMSNTVSNMVPMTCYSDDGCREAMSVDDIVLNNSNGLVSGTTINNDSGCGNLCRIGLVEDRYYTGNLLNKTFSYGVLRQEYLLKYGEGIVAGNDWSSIASNETDKVFFVNDDLVIDSDLALSTNDFKMVIVSGRITIHPSVTRVDGIYLANNGFNISGENDTQLVIEGVLHTSSGNIVIERSYVDRSLNNTSPAVVIKYRPDIVMGMPANLTKVLSGWKGGI